MKSAQGAIKILMESKFSSNLTSFLSNNGGLRSSWGELRPTLRAQALPKRHKVTPPLSQLVVPSPTLTQFILLLFFIGSQKRRWQCCQLGSARRSKDAILGKDTPVSLLGLLTTTDPRNKNVSRAVNVTQANEQFQGYTWVIIFLAPH